MTSQPPPEKKERVVFDIVRDSECSDCKEELGRGSLIILENGQPLCLECAGLDHLGYLPAGDAALTRRTRKHSRVSIVVVRWSRARKRYERQGIIAEAEAIAQAEEECLDDADLRELRREREAVRRTHLDAEYVADFSRQITELWPGCPKRQAQLIAEHACLKHSGRVGRTAAAKEFDPGAIDLAVRAAIRHRHTRYDELLAEGWERGEAREEVEEDARKVEHAWRTPAE